MNTRISSIPAANGENQVCSYCQYTGLGCMGLDSQGNTLLLFETDCVNMYKYGSSSLYMGQTA